MSNTPPHIFGPVPSRRLGLSLGVDIVPFKVCTLDCRYCQVGLTTEKTLTRQSFVDINVVVEELSERLQQDPKPDYITMSGSGEPTLNRDLGTLIKKIKAITEIPIALITNGTLLYQAEVRKDCCLADVILPSFDGADATRFEQINRPHEALSLHTQKEGLEALRQEYTGQIWLEIFFIQDVNTQADHIQSLKASLETIRPDRIHLNTAVRPTADASVIAVPEATLQTIAETLGYNSEVVAHFAHNQNQNTQSFDAETVLTMLRRRPCSAQDIADGLSLDLNQVKPKLDSLVSSGNIISVQKNGRTFYCVPDQNPT